MKSENTIKQFNEFDEYYIDGKGQVRSKHPDFHIFRFNELGDQVVSRQGPFKTAYYQFALGASLSANVSVFDKNLVAEDYSMVIFLPGQIIEWERTGYWNGYVINVKEEFLNLALVGQALDSYRFLYDLKPLVFTMKREDYLGLSHFYELMLAEYAVLSSENLHVIKNLMQVLLVYINRLINQPNGPEQPDNAFTYMHYQEIATRFKHLVLHRYMESKSVGYYADLLHITPAFLNKCVRQLYSKSPKEFINEVVLLHAQTLLRNSDTSVKELAFQLNFDDYSHFVKFFKQATGLTPAEYRKGNG